MSLDSLQAYAVMSQEAPELAAWSRQPSGHVPDKPDEVVGLDKKLVVPSLDVILPMADIYAGLTFTPEPGAENDNG